MKAREVIETIQKNEGVSRYQLARRLGVHDSMLSRTVNEKSDPGFNTVNDWLDKLGYALEIAKIPEQRIDEPDAFSLDRFGAFLGTLGDAAGKDYDYLAVHRRLKQLLEHYTHERQVPEVNFRPAFIKNRNWRAFYAASVAFLLTERKATIPLWVENDSNRAPHPWSPLKLRAKEHSDFNPLFAKYNVLLPEGELSWI
jgi:transcriptional regulator with XRE-family HTH domain